MHANFPAGLSISHSSYPSTSQFNLGSDAREEELFGALSAEAQDTAIAKYGIAGRVWYILSAWFASPIPPTEKSATGKQLTP